MNAPARPVKITARALWHIPLVLLGVTMLMPLFLMISTSLGTPHMAIDPGEPLWHIFIPHLWRWHNYVDVWKGNVGLDPKHPGRVAFLRYYANSVVVALGVTSGHVFTSALAAYAFARLRWPGRDRIFLAYLATMMVPVPVTLIPQFAIIKHIPEWLGLFLPWIDWTGLRYLGTGPHAPMIGRLAGMDSFFALIAPGMFSAYGTFLMRQFLLGIPPELDEAARIDGASHWQIFRRIIVPLALPGMGTLAIFTFMGAWSNLIWPLVVTNFDAMYTLPLGMQEFQGQSGTQWNLMMGAALLMVLPVVIVFFAGQRAFIRGLAVGAVKG